MKRNCTDTLYFALDQRKLVCFKNVRGKSHSGEGEGNKFMVKKKFTHFFFQYVFIKDKLYFYIMKEGQQQIKRIIAVFFC